MPKHSTLTGTSLHEPKGAASAASGEVYVATGAGSGIWKAITLPGQDGATAGQVAYSDGAGNVTWATPSPAAGTVSQGTYLYADVTTATTPIALTTPGVQYELTNDAAGAATVSFPTPGLPEVWNPTTSRLIWSEGTVLDAGDSMDFRLDIEVTTTSTNTAIEVVLEAGLGGTPVVLTISPQRNFKAVGTYEVIEWMGFVMRNSDVITLPARLLISADTAGVTVKVNEWYFRATHTNT